MPGKFDAFGLRVRAGRVVAVAGVMLLAALSAVAEPDARGGGEVFDVGPIEGLVIDGNPDDWGDRGLSVEVLLPRGGPVLPRSDFGPRARFAWDPAGLAVLVLVADDRAVESPKRRPWLADSVELFLAAGEGLRQRVQVVVTPGLDPAHGGVASFEAFDRRDDQAAAFAPEVAGRPMEGGYAVEVRFPWAAMGVTPGDGEVVALNLQVNDRDHATRDRRDQVSWFPTGWAGKGPQHMHRLRLRERAGPSVVRAAALGTATSLQHQHVDVVATPDHAGRKLTLTADNRTLVETAYKSADGYAAATLRFDTTDLDPDSPMTLTLREEGVPFYTFTPDDARPQVRQGVRDARLDVQAVFSGLALPDVNFENRAWIEAMLGDYTLTTAYYDAEMNPVTQASEPGRYGAVTTVASDKTSSIYRYTTLYRIPDDAEVDWQTLAVTGLRLPGGLGLDPAVLERQSHALQRFAQDELRSKFRHHTPGPVLLSWLHETAPEAPRTYRGHDPSSADERYWLRLQKQLGHFRHRYHLYLPEGYNDPAHAQRRWPVILFLHGSGERGLAPQPEPTNGPAVAAERDGLDMPFVIISPQCEPGRWWTAPRVLDLLDEVLPVLRIDPDRVYLTGLSMGGYGSWYAAIADPGRFAAVAPICGGGVPEDAGRLVDLPIWAFHGDRDEAVVPEYSTAMIDGIRGAGGRHATLTLYPGVRHNSWDITYRNPALYRWFLNNRRGQPPVTPSPEVLREALEQAD